MSADPNAAADSLFADDVLGSGLRKPSLGGSLRVKLHAEKDIWREARNAERRHGDHAEDRLAQKIHELTAKQQFEEASFWSAVAARLKELHEIKLPGSSVLPLLVNPAGNGRST